MAPSTLRTRRHAGSSALRSARASMGSPPIRPSFSSATRTSTAPTKAAICGSPKARPTTTGAASIRSGSPGYGTSTQPTASTIRSVPAPAAVSIRTSRAAGWMTASISCSHPRRCRMARASIWSQVAPWPMATTASTSTPTSTATASTMRWATRWPRRFATRRTTSRSTSMYRCPPGWRPTRR